MPNQPNADELMIGAGRLYFDRFDPVTGASTSMRFLGECSKFELTPTVEKKDSWNHTKKTRTKLAQITVTQTHTLTIDFAEYSAENLALALLGTTALLTQAGGAITGETIASTNAPTSTVPSVATVVANSVLQVANRMISSPVLKALVGSAATNLVLGADFEIEDATEGLIRILTIANFPVGVTSLTLDYTAAAITATANKKVITAGATPQILGKVMFIGDPVQGKARTYYCWRVHIEPSAAIALIGDDLTNGTLTGEVLDDSANHPAYPLYQVVTR